MDRSPYPTDAHDGTRLADYLLVGPGGVFVVDHQVWPGAYEVTADDSPRLGHARVVAALTILPVADFRGFLHDRDPVFYPTEVATLTEHVRRLFA